MNEAILEPGNTRTDSSLGGKMSEMDEILLSLEKDLKDEINGFRAGLQPLNKCEESDSVSELVCIRQDEQNAGDAIEEIQGIELLRKEIRQEIEDSQDFPNNMNDLLSSIPEIDAFGEDQAAQEQEAKRLDEELRTINRKRRHKKLSSAIVRRIRLLGHFALVSSTIFFILLGTVNYSAYSKIAYNYLNPDNLKNSSKDILNAIDNSKIRAFAEENVDLLKKDQEIELKKNLSKNNVQLRDTYFSPKKLVPIRSDISLKVDIVPYENRVIIPKIGKNIPLVDVDQRRGDMTISNLENLFMKELEKGVVRYPGTAKPGENGVSFIFGHSSNYPWIKGDYNDVFALLGNLEVGDEIIVFYNQKKYIYNVTERQVIKPGNVKITERDPSKKELSVMTCWPVGTTLNRLIVFAEIKESTH